MILYENFLGGQISDNPLSSVATTVNSAGFANLPVVAGVDRMWLVLDPEGVNGNPEIVLVSAHTASATSVTVLRGQQTGLGGFAAREHPTATEWVCAATAQDMVSLLSTLLTAKGDLPTISASNTPARVPVGTDGLPLTADSAQTTGLAYAQLAAAGIANDAVTTAKILDANVTAAKLLVPEVAYVPVLTVWSIGNGSIAGSYIQLGKLIVFRATVLFGSTSTFTAGQPLITLPVAAAASWEDPSHRQSIRATLWDATGASYDGRCFFFDADRVGPMSLNGSVAGTSVFDLNVAGTSPFSWTQNDIIQISGTYVAA